MICPIGHIRLYSPTHLGSRGTGTFCRNAHVLHLLRLLNPSLQETIQLTVSHWLLSHPAVPKFLCFLWWCYMISSSLPLHVKSFSPSSPPCRLSTFNRSTSGISRNIDRSQRCEKRLCSYASHWSKTWSPATVKDQPQVGSCLVWTSHVRTWQSTILSSWKILLVCPKVSTESPTAKCLKTAAIAVSLQVGPSHRGHSAPLALSLRPGAKGTCGSGLQKSILSCQFHAIS